MGTVHVGVGHDDDVVIAQLGNVEGFALAGAYRRDHRPDFLVAQDALHLVQEALNVEDLALQRQNRLELAVAAHLGRPAGGLTFNNVELGLCGIPLGAVGQLAGQ